MEKKKEKLISNKIFRLFVCLIAASMTLGIIGIYIHNSTVKELSVCLIAMLMALGITGICFHEENRVEAGYDYSTVKELSGVVTRVECYTDGLHESFPVFRTVTIELEDGREVDIDIGTAGGYKVGDKVIIYTDGKSYHFTQVGICWDNTKIVYYGIAPAILLTLCIILWGVWFGWKGVLFVAVALLLVFAISEA